MSAGNPKSDLDAVLAYADANREPALERLFALLRIRSISIDPAYAAERRACAHWHVADLRSIGFEARAHDTPGHPVVLARGRAARRSGPATRCC
jgi:acetylornithine deacetylase/succinyl-diaminopimelate desuccinylase-like protein